MSGELPATDYQPIDCGVHDRLESLATLRLPVSIRYRGDSGEVAEVRGRITDIYARDGAEYLEIDDTTVIRLDRLDRVTEDAGR